MSDSGSGEFPSDFDPGDYEIAGFLPLEGDFGDDYVNTESWEFVDDHYLEDADYVVVHDIENDIYFTLAGPFDDYDDLSAAIAEWYEEGS